MTAREQAHWNMQIFCKDVGVPADIRPDPDVSDDDLFSFTLHYYDEGNYPSLPVDMPGLPIEKVRYVDDSKDAGTFPHLYINGDASLWVFAVRRAQYRFGIPLRDPPAAIPSLP